MRKGWWIKIKADKFDAFVSKYLERPSKKELNAYKLMGQITLEDRTKFCISFKSYSVWIDKKDKHLLESAV